MNRRFTQENINRETCYKEIFCLATEVRGMLKNNVENEDVEHIKIKGWKFGKFGIVPLS